MRDIAVERLTELWALKSYKLETLFLAVNIFDRILQNLLTQTARNDLILFVVVALILAAKMEQPISPSINRMIKLLDPDTEEIHVSKQQVIDLEELALGFLQFDMNYVSSLNFLERFLRVSNLHNVPAVSSLATNLLQLCAGSSKFLGFKQVEIAMACLTVANRTHELGGCLDRALKENYTANSQKWLNELHVKSIIGFDC
jgi:transcription initiation factor TFIIIB Brf1 subunit/transcription initiation factor TFIIB